MCYFALLAEAFKQKFLSPRPPPAFSFIPFFFFPLPQQTLSSTFRATLLSVCGRWSLAEAPCRRTGLLFGE